ncbi:MAG: YtxH domain-containing protein [Candidatus Peregrinibacteria bacterium]
MENFDTPPSEEKKEGKFSRLFLGLIVGGAVGSVLGATLSDEKNRKFMKDKSLEAYEKGKEFIEETFHEKKKTGFWHYLNRVFHGTKD